MIRARLIVSRASETSLLSHPDTSPRIIVQLKWCSPGSTPLPKSFARPPANTYFIQRWISFVHWWIIWPMSRNPHEVSPSGGSFENISRGVVPTYFSHGWTLWAASQQQVSRYTVVISVWIMFRYSVWICLTRNDSILFVESCYRVWDVQSEGSVQQAVT